ncbi:hypothetical protein WHT83_08880 [Aminobacter sp. P9b]|uniref:hypothetical protein n=1 Tax=Aminobacter sp. P9b TaxID=3133697 RepID=UPI00324D0897
MAGEFFPEPRARDCLQDKRASFPFDPFLFGGGGNAGNAHEGLKSLEDIDAFVDQRLLSPVDGLRKFAGANDDGVGINAITIIPDSQPFSQGLFHQLDAKKLAQGGKTPRFLACLELLSADSRFAAALLCLLVAGKHGDMRHPGICLLVGEADANEGAGQREADIVAITRPARIAIQNDGKERGAPCVALQLCAIHFRDVTWIIVPPQALAIRVNGRRHHSLQLVAA